jgi:hypothetical protein
MWDIYYQVFGHCIFLRTHCPPIALAWNSIRSCCSLEHASCHSLWPCSNFICCNNSTYKTFHNVPPSTNPKLGLWHMYYLHCIKTSLFEHLIIGSVIILLTICHCHNFFPPLLRPLVIHGQFTIPSTLICLDIFVLQPIMHTCKWNGLATCSILHKTCLFPWPWLH